MPLYSADSAEVPAATPAVGSPPWQSVHPSSTVFVACIVGSSAVPWHEMHPVDFRSASSCDCPRNPPLCPASCAAATTVPARSAKTASTAEHTKHKAIETPA